MKKSSTQEMIFNISYLKNNIRKPSYYSRNFESKTLKVKNMIKKQDIIVTHMKL